MGDNNVMAYTHRVRRGWTGYPQNTFVTVDPKAPEWRNAAKLERMGYIVPLTDDDREKLRQEQEATNRQRQEQAAEDRAAVRETLDRGAAPPPGETGRELTSDEAMEAVARSIGRTTIPDVDPDEPAAEQPRHPDQRPAPNTDNDDRRHSHPATDHPDDEPARPKDTPPTHPATRNKDDEPARTPPDGPVSRDDAEEARRGRLTPNTAPDQPRRGPGRPPTRRLPE